LFEVILQLALVVGFWINYDVNQSISDTDLEQWRIPVAIQFIPVGFMLIMVPFCTVESPRWLVSKSRSPEAFISLAWMRNLPEDHTYVQH
jgi:hypothetical protein